MKKIFTLSATAVFLTIAFVNLLQAQSTILKPCELKNVSGQVLCGGYEVFENRENSTGRKIPINIVVLKATGETQMPGRGIGGYRERFHRWFVSGRKICGLPQPARKTCRSSNVYDAAGGGRPGRCENCARVQADKFIRRILWGKRGTGLFAAAPG